MTEMPKPMIAVQLKFQPPGAAAPTERLAALDQETLEKVDQLLAGTPLPTIENPPLPGRAGEFVSVLEKLLAALGECDAMYDVNGITHPTPGQHATAQYPLSALRDFGSGPKQVAHLLGCHAGYFVDQGEDPFCLFSMRRFQPTPMFYDLTLEQTNAKS